MGELTGLVLWFVGLFVAYWMIRAAVKGGILDADQARARATSVKATQSVRRDD